MGETVTLAAADGHEFGAYRARPKGKAVGGLVVLQEIFGVNDHIRGLCDSFAADGFDAIAPALFDRKQSAVELAYDDDGIAAPLPGLPPRAWIWPAPRPITAARSSSFGVRGRAVPWCFISARRIR